MYVKNLATGGSYKRTNEVQYLLFPRRRKSIPPGIYANRFPIKELGNDIRVIFARASLVESING